jgi:hypothetical protein
VRVSIVREEPEAAQKERDRVALMITLGAIQVLLWEPKEDSGVNDSYRKLLAYAERVIRHEMLPRYSSSRHPKIHD